MALSDSFKRIATPGVDDLTIFVGGDGQSFQRDYVFAISGTPEDLTDVTPTAEIRDLADDLIVAMTATVTDAASGAVRVTLTRAAADAISWPTSGPYAGKKSLRGRWHLRLEDGATSAVVLSGEVTVQR